VLGHCRPEMRDERGGDGEPGVPKLVDSLAQEVGVECGDALDDEAEARGLVGELAVPDVAVMSEMNRVARKLCRDSPLLSWPPTRLRSSGRWR